MQAKVDGASLPKKGQRSTAPMKLMPKRGKSAGPSRMSKPAGRAKTAGPLRMAKK